MGRARMTDVLVLCYHAVSERWPADLSVTPARLEEQLELLVERGYRGATFLESVTRPPAARTVAVTFDDAYRSVLTRAFPILAKLGLTATVFVPTGFPGSGAPLAWPGTEHWLRTPHASELAPLSWDELRGLGDEGWEIGSHTKTHPRLTQLDDRALEAEMRESREECEQRLDRACPTLAYPYGDVDMRVRRFAECAGYRLAAALPRRLGPAHLLEWPRVGIYHGDDAGRFRMKVSPAGRRLRASPAWTAVEGLGRLRRAGRG